MSVSVDHREPLRKEVALETISVIVPVTERYDGLEAMHREYTEALRGTGRSFEMIYVVDGGFRKAYLELKAMKERGERLILVRHSRPFGEAVAITSGFQQASGGIILTLPAYHQVEAADLPRLIGSLDDNDMVVARRWPRTDSKWNQMQTMLFHAILRRMTGNICNDLGCGVRLFRRRILEEINLYGDLHRFLPILSHKQGFRIREIDMRQSTGESRLRTYPFGTYVRRMIDLLTVFFLIKFTKKPLRFFGLTGSVILVTGLAITSWLVVSRIFFDVGLSDRPLFLIGILFVVLGLQIFAIGLIGEIIIFTHAKEIKEYHVDEIIN
ncbi:MAG: glycosyltransferase [Deltaproteobacteria bacterium]|nr:glycosyltransferase [Candidatus Deferrimicrobiaceae bacterium]